MDSNDTRSSSSTSSSLSLLTSSAAHQKIEHDLVYAHENANNENLIEDSLTSNNPSTSAENGELIKLEKQEETKKPRKGKKSTLKVNQLSNVLNNSNSNDSGEHNTSSNSSKLFFPKVSCLGWRWPKIFHDY